MITTYKDDLQLYQGLSILKNLFAII